MRIAYHPDFAKDIRKFEREYKTISDGLAARFRAEVDRAIEAIKAAPERAGHFLQIERKAILAYRRCNLRVFPFFILYASTSDALYLGSVVPSRSDPLTWLTRFS
jgi:hypothetical protein